MARIEFTVTEEDKEKAAKSGDFKLAPEGYYTANVQRCDYVKAKEEGKSDYINLGFELTGLGRTGLPLPERYGWVFEIISMSEGSGWRRVQFADAFPNHVVEANGKLSFDDEEILGTPCVLRVTHEKGRDGREDRARVGSMSKIGSDVDENATDPFGSTVDDSDPFGSDQSSNGGAPSSAASGDDPFAEGNAAETPAAPALTETVLDVMTDADLVTLARTKGINPMDHKGADKASTRKNIIDAILAPF